MNIFRRISLAGCGNVLVKISARLSLLLTYVMIQAAWDDSDWKKNETEENSNKLEENSDWNKSPPSSPPPSCSSDSHSTPPPSPLFNNDIKNHFETLGIAITSYLKEVKFAYRNLILIFHPDKYNKKKPFTEEEGSSKFQCVFNAYKSLIESNSLF